MAVLRKGGKEGGVFGSSIRVVFGWSLAVVLVSECVCLCVERLLGS